MAQREKFEPPPTGSDRPSNAAGEQSEDEVDRLTRLRLVETGLDPGGRVPRAFVVELAARIYTARRKRSRYLEEEMLGEPAWDMLLALFCLPRAQWRRMTITSLSEAARIPLTTGLRWAKALERQGLITRNPDPLDGRRVFIFLSEEGEQLMYDYFSSIYHSFSVAGAAA